MEHGRNRDAGRVSLPVKVCLPERSVKHHRRGEHQQGLQSEEGLRGSRARTWPRVCPAPTRHISGSTAALILVSTGKVLTFFLVAAMVLWFRFDENHAGDTLMFWLLLSSAAQIKDVSTPRAAMQGGTRGAQAPGGDRRKKEGPRLARGMSCTV